MATTADEPEEMAASALYKSSSTGSSLWNGSTITRNASYTSGHSTISETTTTSTSTSAN
ncbi:hypothetical protein BGW38_001080, partial [Lunasporangiospora selenospora]